METLQIIMTVVGGIVLVGGVAMYFRRMRGARHGLTRPALRNRAREESRKLFRFVDEREAARPERDPIIKDHDHQHRRVTAHDEETQEIYHEKYVSGVAEIRDHFAEHRVHSRELDDLYESVENTADIRTLATALTEMSERLK